MTFLLHNEKKLFIKNQTLLSDSKLKSAVFQNSSDEIFFLIDDTFLHLYGYHFAWVTTSVLEKNPKDTSGPMCSPRTIKRFF